MNENDFRQLNILLIEDHAGSRRLTRSMLMHLGIRNIAEAEDGTDAIDELANFSADIAICDWRMRPMDGLEFSRRIRAGEVSDHTKSLPIIMLSAHAERDRIELARDIGVNEFLVKPVSVRTLKERLVAVLSAGREFIVTNDYTGPDRRRRVDPAYRGPERRDGAGAVANEPAYVEPGEADYQEAIMNLRARAAGDRAR